jgi:hypothetical protein
LEKANYKFYDFSFILQIKASNILEILIKKIKREYLGCIIDNRADPREGWRTRRAPLKLEKNLIFWRQIVIFHTKYPKNVHASLRNWKKYDFLA